jgi:hypothetical protein
MIYLNDPKYSEKLLVDRDAILEKVSDFNIFKFYYPELDLIRNTKSPFHKDNNESLRIFWSSKYNMFMFKDFGGSGLRGDVFVFVSKLTGLNYYETLVKIIIDFNLDDYFNVDSDIKPLSKPTIYSPEQIKSFVKDSVELQIKLRELRMADIAYWNQFGVRATTLKKYGVFPISHIFINENIIKADIHAYVYTELKDSILRYKIYQPLSKKMKWLNNMVEGTLSGWSQMADSGEMLIIASSLKDAMCLHDLGYENVIAPQTENYIHKPHIIDILKSRFKLIYIFYDYDEAGIRASNNICKMYNLRQLFTMDNKLKDPSDFYRAKGGELLKQLIKEQL